LRGRDGARSDRLRQRGADEPAAVAARIERSHLTLAGRRSLEPGILLLRRQGTRGPALLRASLARRISAGRRSPPSAAEADEVRARFVVARMEQSEIRDYVVAAEIPRLRFAPPGLRTARKNIRRRPCERRDP